MKYSLKILHLIKFIGKFVRAVRFSLQAVYNKSNWKAWFSSTFQLVFPYRICNKLILQIKVYSETMFYHISLILLFQLAVLSIPWQH